MKKLKKALSLLLTAVILFSALGFSSYAYDTDLLRRNATVSFEMLASPKTDLFSLMYGLISAGNFITKNRILPDNNLDVEFEDGIAVDLCNYIYENSGLDIINLFQNLPLNATGLKFFYETTDADTTALRNTVYNLRDECRKNGNDVLANVLHFFGAYLSGIEKVTVSTKPYGNNGIYRVYVTADYLDGTNESVGVDIFFTKDGIAYGSHQKGILSLGYECSVYELIVYATVNSWMRNFGFDLLYDIFCYTTPFFNYITRRFKFNYDEKEWLIQVWKGNYLITNGAEVGIYNREKGAKGTYYNCCDSEMNMSMSLSVGEKLIFEKSDCHWWLNGFKLGKELCSPNDMTLDFSIVFPNTEMAQAFAESVRSNYMQDTFCTLRGTLVSVKW